MREPNTDNSASRPRGEYSPHELEIFNQRLNDLKAAYRSFKESKIKSNPRLDFKMNQSLLVTVCLLYISDLRTHSRKRDGSSRPYTDRVRRAAHISRIISKFRPIVFEGAFDSVDTEVMMVNEEFAVFVFFLYLGITPDNLPSQLVKDLARDLKYVFAFSDPQVDLLVTLARVLTHLTTEGGHNSQSGGEPA